MFLQAFPQLEPEFLRGLNSLVEPLVRAGFGSPLLSPAGAIVLETTGRKTGRIFNVPLLATRVGDLLLVSTARKRSQWLKNLAADAEVRYWMRGRLHEATAYVLASGIDSRLDEMPPLARCLAAMLIPHSRLFGVGFAILAPRTYVDEV